MLRIKQCHVTVLIQRSKPSYLNYKLSLKPVLSLVRFFCRVAVSFIHSKFICLFYRFLVIVVLYLGIGIAYKHKQGAQGNDKLPNREFWAKMPGLIKVWKFQYFSTLSSFLHFLSFRTWNQPFSRRSGQRGSRFIIVLLEIVSSLFHYFLINLEVLIILRETCSQISFNF